MDELTEVALQRRTVDVEANLFEVAYAQDDSFDDRQVTCHIHVINSVQSQHTHANSASYPQRDRQGYRPECGGVMRLEIKGKSICLWFIQLVDSIRA